MGTVHHIKSSQKIPAGIDTVWKFFSDPHNLMSLTPPFLNLKVTNEIFGDEVYAGQIITYSVRPLLNVPVFWMTEITHVERNKIFVDEQRKGPYRLWHHLHHFKIIPSGVEMTDLVHYRLPGGFLGNLAHGLVRKKLEEIFTYRYFKVIETFGAAHGEEMQLLIN